GAAARHAGDCFVASLLTRKKEGFAPKRRPDRIFSSRAGRPPPAGGQLAMTDAAMTDAAMTGVAMTGVAIDSRLGERALRSPLHQGEQRLQPVRLGGRLVG